MKKVMIVDDNYLSTEGIVKNINWQRLDAEVTHVENNGESAIDAIKKDPVDLIISDIEMPDLDGISMRSLAISINPLVKIILISAYDSISIIPKIHIREIIPVKSLPAGLLLLTSSINATSFLVTAFTFSPVTIFGSTMKSSIFTISSAGARLTLLSIENGHISLTATITQRRQ